MLGADCYSFKTKHATRQNRENSRWADRGKTTGCIPGHQQGVRITLTSGVAKIIPLRSEGGTACAREIGRVLQNPCLIFSGYLWPFSVKPIPTKKSPPREFPAAGLD
jgi:hypothetical protein